MDRSTSTLRNCKQDPEFAPAYRELGRMYIMSAALSSGQYEINLLETAEKQILKSIQIEPEYADSYVLLGHLYATFHDMKKAENALLKATEIGTKSPWLPLNFAAVHKYKRHYEKEYQAYLKVVESDTKNNKALLSASFGLKKYFEKKKDYVNADLWFEKSMAYSKENAWAWGNHASVLVYTRGDFDKGIEYAEKALSIMSYGMARSVLSNGLYSKWSQELKLGNTLKANEYYARAYDLNPDLESAILYMSKFDATKETSKSLEKVLKESKE